MNEINGTVATKEVWINLQLMTGMGCSHLPKEIREDDEPLTHVDSYNYLVNDPACDPRFHEVIAGAKNIAEYYGVSVQYFNRCIRPTLSYLRYIGGIPLTNVSSVQADGILHKINSRRTRCQNLGVLPTDSSSGSNY